MNKKGILTRRRCFWTIVTAVYVLFMFHNSATVAVESSRQSGRALMLVQNLLESLGMNGGWITEHLIRKTAHFLEYSLYGVLLWQCLEVYEIHGKLRFLTHAWFQIMTPFLDETIQLFTEGRSGQISDVWLDMAGVLAGTCLMIGIAWSFRKWKGMGRK